jgi:DnaJ like chaperone protein
MAKFSKFLWGGLGWAIGGPIGGIIGFALGTLIDHSNTVVEDGSGRQTLPGDFGVSLLILCAAVMKSDDKLLKSELEYVKRFFISQFGVEHAQERMLLFREILKQNYSLPEVCMQIDANLDYPSKLQLVHLLFGLANSDGELHTAEMNTIRTIAGYLHISAGDLNSMSAMFVKDISSAYDILEITRNASNDEIKKAFRKLAALHHPDKVEHLGEDFRKASQEKFKSINEAYTQIKKERGIN